MKARRWLAGMFLVVIALAAVPAMSGNNIPQEFSLFNGSDVDSTEHVSPWIPVRGANRVILKTWTTKAAFHVSTDADSNYSDSITTFKAGFSDSVLFMARDSSGTLVTASSSIPRTTAHGEPYPICGDSLVITTTTNPSDTLVKLVSVKHHPVNKVLRSPENGSGVYTVVFATAPGSIGAYGDGTIAPSYMRIYLTPLRRATAATGLATVPRRVNGLKGLRMKAYVRYNNK